MAQEQECTATATGDIWKNYSPPTLNAEGKQEITCRVGESPSRPETEGSLCSRIFSGKCNKKISGDNLLEEALVHHCERHDRGFFEKYKLCPQHECIFWGVLLVGVLIVLSFENHGKIDETAHVLITSICSLTPHREQICGPRHQWQGHAAKNTRMMHEIFLFVAPALFGLALFVIMKNLDKDVKIAIWHYYSAPKLNAEGLSEVTCSVQTGFFANEKCNEKLVGDNTNTLREKALLHYCQCHSNVIQTFVVKNKYQLRTTLVCMILLIILLACFAQFGDEQKVNREIKASITSICALTSANHKSCRYFKESQRSVFSSTLKKGFEYLQNSSLGVFRIPAVLISLTVLILLGLFTLVKIIVRVKQLELPPLSDLPFKNREDGVNNVVSSYELPIGRELENQRLITDYFPRLDRSTTI